MGPPTANLSTAGLRAWRPASRLTRRRLLLLGASHVAPYKNPANSVVAPVAVLGSETVGLLGTQKLSTHGTRAFRLAKHDSPKRSFWVSSATTSNNIAMH